MAKMVSTIKQEVKFLGIKIFENIQHIIEMSTEEDVEDIRDDIILHENMIKNKKFKNN